MTTAAKHSFINSAPQFNADKFKAYMAHPRNGEKASILWPMLRWRFDEIPKPPANPSSPSCRRSTSTSTPRSPAEVPA